LESQPDVSLTLNYPPTSLIFGIDVNMAGVDTRVAVVQEDMEGNDWVPGDSRPNIEVHFQELGMFSRFR
jgi:hypothetical protein